ncbi:MFS transporter [Streptomyces sp. NPDC087440]|uniref:MFS transporter n=1 Tax=Streptomyces sp. NPDC087440 TaxID=3365790 RepID=UPI0037F8DC01
MTSTTDTKPPGTNPWAALGMLCLGVFMTLLDVTIVSSATPSLIETFDASIDQAVWVFSAYIMAFSTTLILAGRLGDLHGPRRVYLIGLTVFGTASVLCGIAQEPWQLICFRVLQGLGGALLVPQLMPMITTLFPPQKWGAAFGFTGALSGLAVLAGPLIGGLLVTNASWRWIFYVNLPIGLLTFFLVVRFLPDPRPGLRRPLGVGSVLLLLCGMGAVVFGLVEGERLRWSAAVWAVIGAGLVLLAVFFADQRRRQSGVPLVPFALFKVRSFTLMNLIAVTVGFGVVGAFLPLTLYLQSVQGLSAARAGLVIAVMPLLSVVSAAVSGRIIETVGPKRVLLCGLVSFAAGLALLALQATADASVWQLIGPLALAGVGTGFTFAPLFSVGMREVPPQLSGVASGTVNTVQEFGGLLASAVIGMVLQLRLGSGQNIATGRPVESGSSPAPGALDAFHEALAGAIRVSMLTQAIVVAAGALCAFAIRPGPPQPAPPENQSAPEARTADVD